MKMYDRLVWEVWMPFLRSAIWYVVTILIYYLFNRFRHDYNAKKDWEKNTFEQVTKTRDEGAGHTTERGSKLSVPLRKIHKY